MSDTSIIIGHETVELSTLEHYHDNPRIGNVEKIKESLTANLQYRELIVDVRTREILGGNHTFKAMNELGWTHADITWIRPIDDDHALRIVLVDNATADDGTYDNLLLATVLGELREEDIDKLVGTGYTSDEVDELLADVTLEFYSDDPDVDEEEVSHAAALLNRLMPAPLNHSPEAETVLAATERAEKVREEMESRPAPPVFVVFRFGELQAKVSKEAYDAFMAAWMSNHDGLASAGIAAVVTLGFAADDVKPALAEGAERWL
jgi:hypothetical protein